LILLNNQRINESKKLKSVHQQELNAGFDQDSDEEEIEEEEEFYDDDELLKKCVNKLLKDKKFLTTNGLSLNPAELEVNYKIFSILNSTKKERNYFV